MREQYINVNSFNMPSVSDGDKTDIIMIIRLIMMEPGTIQSTPEMGVGLVRNWRYSFSENISGLEDEIKKQMITYLPHINTINVSVKHVSRRIIITISSDEKTYKLSTNNSITKLHLDDILKVVN